MDKCCERDHDGDGNCDRHPAKPHLGMTMQSDRGQSPLPNSHPLMKAWTAWQDTDEARNATKWLDKPEHRQGSMWCAYMNGWRAALSSTPAPCPASEGVFPCAEYNPVTGRLICNGCGHDIVKLTNRWFHCTEGSPLQCPEAAPATSPKPDAGKAEAPHRAYELDIRIGGDTFKDVTDDLREIATHIRVRGEKCGSVMGSPGCGHTVTSRVDKAMTHERYVAELEAYLENRNKTAHGQTGGEQ